LEGGERVRVISREALYAQVWERPMATVAVEYGLTGPALKKICDDHEIPTPGSGHWMKLAFGKPLQVKALPGLADPSRSVVRLKLAKGVRAAKPAVPEKAIERKTSTEAEPQDTPSPPRGEHPALRATHKAISAVRSDAAGFAKVHGKGIVPLRIAPASIGPHGCPEPAGVAGGRPQ